MNDGLPLAREMPRPTFETPWGQGVPLSMQEVRAWRADRFSPRLADAFATLWAWDELDPDWSRGRYWRVVRSVAPIPSPDTVSAAREHGRGWTREQLAKWGVPWPPPAGWRRQLEHEWVTKQREEDWWARRWTES